MLLAAIIGRKKRAVFCDSTALDNPQTTLKSFLKRMFFRFCDGFFAYGKRSGDYLNMHGVPHPRIFTRCQSAALPHDYTPQKALELRLKNWPNAQEPRVLYVGRLDEEKRIDTLISAFGIVLSRYPNAKLAIVGAGRLESALQEQSNALGLHASAMWLGSMGIEQLQFQYAASTCLVLPSQSEPWGLVVNEALSYGCPVIVSDRCGCIPELVLDSVTGFAFPIGNAEELANRIVRSVVEFSQRVEIAKSCIEHMASFTPDAAAEQMLQGCRKLLNT
jgi:glycosyltransferase involved in cell wall biosynthesis